MKWLYRALLAGALMLAPATQAFADIDFDPDPPPPLKKSQSAGKHHASTLQKFGIATGVCMGVSVGAVIVVKKRLPYSGEWAYITVQCLVVGAASLVPVLGPIVIGVVIVDGLFFDGRILKPVLQPLADVIEPLFRWLDPTYAERMQKPVKKHVRKHKPKRKILPVLRARPVPVA